MKQVVDRQALLLEKLLGITLASGVAQWTSQSFLITGASQA